MTKVSAGLILFASGAATGILLTCWGVNKQVDHLKQSGDSAQVIAQHRDEAATARFVKDSLYIVKLKATKAPAVIQIARDSAAARTAAEAVRRAASASDSNAAYIKQVAALESEVRLLKSNAVLDSLSLFTAMGTARQLRDSLHAQTKTIVDLNGQIQRLNSHRLPKWARTTLEIARTGLAIKGLVDVAAGQ